MNDLIKRVEDRIEKAEATFLALPVTEKQAKAAQEEFRALLRKSVDGGKMTKADKKKMNDITDSGKLKAASLLNQIEMLKETLKMGVVKVEATKGYIIAQGVLSSPAGFHPSEMVFAKLPHFEVTDKLPRNNKIEGLNYWVIEDLIESNKKKVA